MTDRLKGLIVTFENDIREDDAQPIIDAIRCLRGVVNVRKSVRDYNDLMCRVQVTNEIREKIFKALDI